MKKYNLKEDLAKDIGCKPEEIIELSMDEFEEWNEITKNAVDCETVSDLISKIREYVESSSQEIHIESMDLITQLKLGFVDKTNKKLWTISINKFKDDDESKNKTLQSIKQTVEGRTAFNKMLSQK